MNYLGRLAALGTSAVLISGMVSAEVKRLDDAQLSSVTGQAGLTVEVNNAEMTIAEVRWHDAGFGSNGGSIAVRDVRIGGADRTNFFGRQWLPATVKTDKLDNFKIDIDILENGNFRALLGPAGTYSVVDFSLSTGEWALMNSSGVDSGTKLFNSLNIEGIGIDAVLLIENMTSHTYIETTWGVDDLDVDIDFLGMKIENGFIAGTSYFERISRFGAGSAGIPDIGAEADFELYTAINAQGNTALGFNVTKFQADIGLPSIYLGNKPSIGGLYFNDVSVVAETVIYGH